MLIRWFAATMLCYVRLKCVLGLPDRNDVKTGVDYPPRSPRMRRIWRRASRAARNRDDDGFRARSISAEDPSSIFPRSGHRARLPRPDFAQKG